jgi:hypothetical protein
MFKGPYGHQDLYCEDRLKDAERKEARTRQHMLLDPGADARCVERVSTACCQSRPCCRLLTHGALNSLADVTRAMHDFRELRDRERPEQKRPRFNPDLARQILLNNEPSLADANLAPLRRSSAEQVCLRIGCLSDSFVRVFS